MENLEILINRLRELPNETGWVEFKTNNTSPEMIGEDISALANSAALQEKSCAYMVWGIDDQTHEIRGTDFYPETTKKGGQELESWLRNLLSDHADFEFHSVRMGDKHLAVLIIYRAVNQTVKFKKIEYIRVGSYTTKLMEYPVMQAKLWDRLRAMCYEEAPARKELSADEALELLNYSVYFELKKERQPTNRESILHYMLQEDILKKQDNGLYEITNLGAILFAKRLDDFPRLARKAVRVVQYGGNDKLRIIREDIVGKGYAVGFTGLLQYIQALLPMEEVIRDGLRITETAYPPIAIREAVANALIHQDFSITGTGPVVELFEKRIEITNPGVPLVDVYRFVDNPPRSRNEKLASLMRRLGMCEELGTGWDKIVISCEMKQLPAPSIKLYESNTKVALYSEKPFTNLSADERLWSCYLHACIKQVSGDYVTNASLRGRFGVKASSSASISRLIKEAVSKGYIKPLDPDTSPKHMKYLPFWA